MPQLSISNVARMTSINYSGSVHSACARRLSIGAVPQLQAT